MADNKSDCWTCNPVTNLTTDVNLTWAQWLCGKPTCWPSNIVVNFTTRQVTGITEAQRLQLDKCEPDDAGTYAPWIVALRDILMSWEIDRLRCSVPNVCNTLSIADALFYDEALGAISAVGGQEVSITPWLYEPGDVFVDVSACAGSAHTWAELRINIEMVMSNITFTPINTADVFRFWVEIDGRKSNQVRMDQNNDKLSEYGGFASVIVLAPISSGVATFTPTLHATVSANENNPTVTATATAWSVRATIDLLRTQ